MCGNTCKMVQNAIEWTAFLSPPPFFFKLSERIIQRLKGEGVGPDVLGQAEAKVIKDPNDRSIGSQNPLRSKLINCWST